MWAVFGEAIFSRKIRRLAGGEGAIPTPDTVTRMPHFECGAFNHSATSPAARSAREYLAKGPGEVKTLSQRRGPRVCGAPLCAAPRPGNAGSIHDEHGRAGFAQDAVRRAAVVRGGATSSGRV